MRPTTQEDKFNLLLNWLRSFSIEPDQEKLKRQVINITRWQAINCNGFLEAVTGYGKTWVALFAIYLLKRVHLQLKTIIVVPSEKLFNDWNEHIKNFNLSGCKVYIVNSYTKQEFWESMWDCDLLIADEGHRYLGEESVYFSKVLQITNRKALLGLSATLDEEEKGTLVKLGIPIFDVVTIIEAKRMGFISDFVTYNFAVNLPKDEQVVYDELHKWHNDMYARFAHFSFEGSNYELATACGIGNDKRAKVNGEWKTGRQWKEWYAQEQQWDGTPEHDWSPQNIGKYSAQWNLAMMKRKNLLYKHPLKINAAVEIINYLKLRTITFAENIETANILALRLGSIAKPYHSEIATIEVGGTSSKRFTSQVKAQYFAAKNNGIVISTEDDEYEVQYNTKKKLGGKSLKKQILRDFELDKFSVLCTAKALDEGFNVEGIECAIFISGTSKQRQYIQRRGRAIRFIAGKLAFIINIYVNNSKDKAWLERRQKGETGIKWIDKLEQIEISNGVSKTF